MRNLYTNIIKTDRQQELFDIVDSLGASIKERALNADEKADFPEETLRDLKEVGYPALPLPHSHGGRELSLYELLLIQERLAVADGSVALSIGWHMGIIMELRDEGLWSDEDFDVLAHEIQGEQKVVNRAASEPATGSPTRGGRPETTAKKNGNTYNVTGRKTFTSMASVLDYYIVSAYVEEKDQVGWFLIDSSLDGVSIDYTWDTVGMRGTGSHDLVLNNVQLPEKRLVEMATKSKKPKGWLLHIPACYLGIAIAARNDAIDFAKSFQPNSLDTPISEVPHVRQKIGEMDLKLMNARHFMYSIADQWDRYPDKREQLGETLGAIKTIATNAANEIVDLAMRIAGGRGLSKKYAFERYYRDVRAGLHNPPMDDAVIENLAKQAIHNAPEKDE
ncbi:acyl-CoA dehydrogenase [Pontibacillus yanchengensis]|uniref:Acyl-CoA dehydrogenase n=2 Tax=Pontibacillus yanchengensis TaxID=462910 RepID=A0A6I5A177_9BACI|nr:acyl-CoA dehydrogenase family protein [Pontibacillus yanchengensis]MYL34052.1 acyl-CoA dehydrogenase [Pontibacillus yanchengensis]MYL53140.1 acyl-CoA dehydrogenase [Pontibacillus yanchengensis]